MQIIHRTVHSCNWKIQQIQAADSQHLLLILVAHRLLKVQWLSIQIPNLDAKVGGHA